MHFGIFFVELKRSLGSQSIKLYFMQALESGRAHQVEDENSPISSPFLKVAIKISDSPGRVLTPLVPNEKIRPPNEACLRVPETRGVDWDRKKVAWVAHWRDAVTGNLELWAIYVYANVYFMDAWREAIELRLAAEKDGRVDSDYDDEIDQQRAECSESVASGSPKAADVVMGQAEAKTLAASEGEDEVVSLVRSGRKAKRMASNVSVGSTECDVKGVSYQCSNSAPKWTASWYANGKRHFRYFKVCEHGFNVAKRLAIESRRLANSGKQSLASPGNGSVVSSWPKEEGKEEEERAKGFERMSIDTEAIADG